MARASLKRRGSRSIWFDPEMEWRADRTGKRGHPETFSDSAIQACLTLKGEGRPGTIRGIVSALNGGSRGMFGLPLRQTVGLVASLIEMAGLNWPVPGYSTLCRRQARIAIQIPHRRSRQPLKLLIDSTDIRFRGDGEWLARKHGATRRRERRKVHLAMDTTTDDIRRVEFTSSHQGDSPILPELLSQIPATEDIETVTADGACDTRRCHAAILQHGQSRSSRSAGTAAPGNLTAPPRSRSTRSCDPHDVWAGLSGRSGPAIMSEVGSRPR